VAKVLLLFIQEIDSIMWARDKKRSSWNWHCL